MRTRWFFCQVACQRLQRLAGDVFERADVYSFFSLLLKLISAHASCRSSGCSSGCSSLRSFVVCGVSKTHRPNGSFQSKQTLVSSRCKCLLTAFIFRWVRSVWSFFLRVFHLLQSFDLELMSWMIIIKIIIIFESKFQTLKLKEKPSGAPVCLIYGSNEANGNLWADWLALLDCRGFHAWETFQATGHLSEFLVKAFYRNHPNHSTSTWLSDWKAATFSFHPVQLSEKNFWIYTSISKWQLRASLLVASYWMSTNPA